MKKKIIITSLILILFIIIYPNIEFFYKDNFYMMTYGKDQIDSKDFQKLDENLCYNESRSYIKDKDISVIDYEYKGFLFFKWFKIRYEKGNICDKEYMLEESYIKRFIKEAKIIENEDKINIEKLIENKKAIVTNKKYPWNENYSYISYKLDNKYEEMYISYTDELLIIQVGSNDESPKFIAYK